MIYAEIETLSNIKAEIIGPIIRAQAPTISSNVFKRVKLSMIT